MKSRKAMNSASVRCLSGCIHHLFDACYIEIGPIQVHDESGNIQFSQLGLPLLDDLECLCLLKDHTGLVSAKTEPFEPCCLVGQRNHRHDEPVFSGCGADSMVARAYFT